MGHTTDHLTPTGRYQRQLRADTASLTEQRVTVTLTTRSSYCGICGHLEHPGYTAEREEYPNLLAVEGGQWLKGFLACVDCARSLEDALNAALAARLEAMG